MSGVVIRMHPYLKKSWGLLPTAARRVASRAIFRGRP
jgi:hypothetical protein